MQLRLPFFAMAAAVALFGTASAQDDNNGDDNNGDDDDGGDDRGPDYTKLYYEGYELTYSCAERSAIRWYYTLAEDFNRAGRPASFFLDPNYSKECQQKSTKAYGAKSGYDRGHLVASSHMRNSENERHESHYMTNIAPQISSFNQGQYVKTESLEACFRTMHGGTRTFGGLKYNETDNDDFEGEWGIKTPDYWWKVVVAVDDDGNDADVIAWWFPNRKGLTAVEDYITSIEFIESQLEDGLGGLDVADELKGVVADGMWKIPSGCGRGGTESVQDN
ncbi:Aste57867_21570 [Aphanomyces stellatus]|uniref:Aste57867_21570 protein n=1 Tax=Aphanomyces stellatus TaxID=120398 RepID=A0A485LJY5_9STRA|nr:hypothetical protein As57867_021501 [Aphanomyces stellatus]VFT98240.1 Aste57867_21570 [Aphanomyces stellatus]